MGCFLIRCGAGTARSKGAAIQLSAIGGGGKKKEADATGRNGEGGGLLMAFTGRAADNGL
jgi:hypothetical protein